MLNKFSLWFNNPIYFRYAFFILMLISLICNYVIGDGDNLFIIYFVVTIFLGFGFYNHSHFILILLTTMVVFCRFHFVQSSASFISYLLTYLLITYTAVGLMKQYQKVKEGTLELILALAKAMDSRDKYTLHHSENVANIAYKIAKKMGLSKSLCDAVHQGGLLHDIGKIGIPEQVLLKESKLTDEEYQTIKGHPVIGYEMIKHVAIFSENGIFDIVLYHHERFDGTGYPYGLKGAQIPLLARIITIADAFDAMMSKRVYRNELSLDICLCEIRKHKGTQFDPDIADVFLSFYEESSRKEKKE